MKSPSTTTEELLRQDNYVFRRLTPAYRKQALHLAAQSFAYSNPLLLAAEKAKDELQGYQTGVQLCLSFWDAIIDECCSNGLSVMICDLDNNDQLVGVTLSKDTSHFSKECQTLMQGDNYFKVLEAATTLINQLDPSIKEAMSIKGKTVDINTVVIKAGHTGKRLLSKMIYQSLRLAQKHKFKYAFCFAGNSRTASSVKGLQFIQKGRFDCSQLVYRGVHIMKDIPEAQRYASVWFKELSG